ncbi:hypothetical protein [Mastigocladopsis repens]|uniref:hypothetical protein n=1 Tax=Mastigocladopsis repens TaxID=221287 RepID=UPI0002F5A748|nr:hypothetical protein [Mastigocladopsis repens]
MFAYADPTGSDFLNRQNALEIYRSEIDIFYRRSALQRNSAFTFLEAFEGLTPEKGLRVVTIPWLAFPKLANRPFEVIDANRFDLQDEYVEWLTETRDGKVTRVTFTTEFPEYYQALAKVSADALIAGIQDTIAGANPTIEELFGSGFNPRTASPQSRSDQFRRHLRQNPWNNGQKGILCLTQTNNTAGALFGLVEPCAISRLDIPAAAVCGQVSCVPERNSDPAICQEAQNAARNSLGLSLQDPVGIKMLRLEGLWNIKGQQIDINDPSENQGAWVISRNGRRAVLDVTQEVTIENTTITTGAQVAAKLTVGADVIAAPESVLPDWAQTGEESSRLISQI